VTRQRRYFIAIFVPLAAITLGGAWTLARMDAAVVRADIEATQRATLRLAVALLEGDSWERCTRRLDRSRQGALGGDGSTGPADTREAPVGGDPSASEDDEKTNERLWCVDGDGTWRASLHASDQGDQSDPPLPSLSARFPDDWARIQASDSGQERTDSGLWTWRRMGRPSALAHPPRTPPGVDQAEGVEPRPWTLVAHVPSARLVGLSTGQIWRDSGVAAGLIALFGVLAWVLASALDGLGRQRLRVKRLAASDGLTGLANRRKLIDQIRRDWSGYQRRPDVPIGVLMMDLDGLDAVRARAGSAAREQVLRQVGRVLRESLRLTDTAGRLGEETFCILLRGSGRAGVEVYAERLRRRIEEECIAFNEKAIRVTASLGGSEFQLHDSIPTAAMQRAEQALHRAKEQGGNRLAMEQEGDTGLIETPA
jgi:diguanylate cyclase (GGDEF)-like protein